MSRARVHEVSSPLSLFPFIGILLCTMGALLVILVVVSRSARDTARREVAAKQQSTARPKDGTHEKLEEVNRYVGSLATVRGEAERKLRDEQTRLSNVEEHIRRLQEKMRSLQTASVELEEMEKEHYDDREQAEREIKRLEKLIEDSKKTITSLQEEGKKESLNYAVIPYEGPNGTFRRPLYIECVKNEMILQPEGVHISADDLRGPLGAGNPLAAALRASRDYIVRLNPGAGQSRDTEPYPLLLVRPDGLHAYDRARQAIEAGDFDLGFELIESDWKVKYPQADPQLADLQQQALEQARVRQQLLAAAAPRAYRGGPTMVAGEFDDDEEDIVGGGSGAGGAGGGVGGGGAGGGIGRGGSRDYVVSRGRGGSGDDDRYSESGGGGDGGAIGGGPGNGGSTGGSDGGSGNGSSGFIGERGTAAVGSNGNSASLASASGSGNTVASGAASGEAGGAPSQSESDGSVGAGGTVGGGAGDGGGAGSSGVPNMAAVGKPTDKNLMPDGYQSQQQGASVMAGAQAPPDSSEPPYVDYSSKDKKTPPIDPAERGKDWALRDKPGRAVPVRRTIRVGVGKDLLNVLSDSGPANTKAIPLNGDTIESLDELVKQVHRQIDGWGIAGNGLYWRPVIVLDVGPDGQRRADDLERLLKNSGLEIRNGETARNPVQGAPHETR
jgi:hypothetical protein